MPQYYRGLPNGVNPVATRLYRFFIAASCPPAGLDRVALGPEGSAG